MLTIHKITNEAEEQEFLEIVKLNKLPFQDIDFQQFSFFLVKDENEKIIGTVGYEQYQSYAILRSLSVSFENKNKGFGKKIIELLEQEAKNNQIEELFLLTTTAKDFFQKQNYYLCDRNNVPEAIANATEFKSVCPASATCMVKKLT